MENALANKLKCIALTEDLTPTQVYLIESVRHVRDEVASLARKMDHELKLQLAKPGADQPNEKEAAALFASGLSEIMRGLGRLIHVASRLPEQHVHIILSGHTHPGYRNICYPISDSTLPAGHWLLDHKSNGLEIRLGDAEAEDLLTDLKKRGVVVKQVADY